MIPPHTPTAIASKLPLDDEIVAIMAQNKDPEEAAPENSQLQTPRDYTSEIEEKVPSASVSQVSMRSGSKSFKPNRASSPRSSPIFYDRPVEERMDELKLSELGENENFGESTFTNEEEEKYEGSDSLKFLFPRFFR